VGSLGLNRANWIPFIMYFSFINPLIEEYFWRGYLGSNTTNPYISDFLYSGFHGLVLMNKLQTASIFLGLAMLVAAGWFWRQVAREDKGLLAPVLGHMAADLSILLVVYWKL
jgi:membrane protease YdiL (CAAX protease family)